MLLNESSMRARKLKLLDTVALLQDIPSRNLKRAEVGTVVERLAPGVYEVEFCDDKGQTYTELALRGLQIVPLDYQGDPSRVLDEQWDTGSKSNLCNWYYVRGFHNIFYDNPAS